MPYELTTVSQLADVQAALGLGIYNLKPSNMKKWMAARARVETGAGRAKIACVGDSTTAGIGAGTSGTSGTSARQRSYPTYLAAALNARNSRLNATNTSRFGTNGISDTAYDSRLSVGAGWSQNVAAPAGRFWNNSSTANAWAFTPGAAVDTAVAYYAANGGLGSLTVDIGGSVLSTINTATSAALGNTSVALGAAASSTINVKRSAGNCFFLGIDAYNSAVPDTAIWNFGASGAKASDIASNAVAYDPLPGLVAMAPDLVILNIGINDWDTDSDQAVFATSMAALITAYKAVADVIVMVPIPSTVGSASIATQAVYAGLIKAAAYAADVPLISMTERWGSAALAPTGFMFDGLHATNLGYSDEADLVAQMLCSI